jgi:hypothetical protein
MAPAPLLGGGGFAYKERNRVERAVNIADADVVRRSRTFNHKALS